MQRMLSGIGSAGREPAKGHLVNAGTITATAVAVSTADYLPAQGRRQVDSNHERTERRVADHTKTCPPELLGNAKIKLVNPDPMKTEPHEHLAIPGI